MTEEFEVQLSSLYGLLARQLNDVANTVRDMAIVYEALAEKARPAPVVLPPYLSDDGRVNWSSNMAGPWNNAGVPT